MEHILRPIYQERASDPNTLGAILVEKIDDLSPETDNIDAILLILVAEAELPVFTKHYTYEEHHAAMHIVTNKQLRKWLLLGTNKKIINWIMDGRVVFDRNETIYSLRQEMRNNPRYGRHVKLGIEFSKLLRRFQEGRVSFEQRDYVDAFFQMMECLHHVARLSIIEVGVYPELKVWEQVKTYNNEIYDLYEGFIEKPRPINQKILEVIVYIESFIDQKVVESGRHIVEVMKQKDVWTIQELHEHEELKNYSINLEVFVEYLIDKGYIKIELLPTKSNDVKHRLYKVE